MKQRWIAWTMLLCLIGQPILPVLAQSMPVGTTFDAGFDPNRILEDDDIFDVNGMTYNQMVDFLRSKGTLADHILTDIDGVPKPAPDIIWRVAMSYKLNPKYLLALIQKEQSLVEDPNPTQNQLDWATGYGVCDGCSKDDPSIQDFKGFASQLEWAAKQYREKYLLQILGNGKTRGGDAPGITMKIDNLTITPANNATAMLYAYTPHLHGNLNLWRIWQRWFSLNFPDGTVVKAKDSGDTYLIRLGQKRAFASPAVLMSMVDPSKILTVSDSELASYPDGPDIRFPNYALLRDQEKKIWLLSNNVRRQIADTKTFKKFGFDPDEVIDVNDSDLADYTVGAAITTKTQFPTGVVMKNKTDGTYWYVEDGTRSLIPDKAFIALYFPGRTIKSTTTKALAAYKLVDPYKLHDGELVRSKSSPSVYVVQDATLSPIPSAEVFQEFGYDWKNVVQLPDKVLATYPIGDPVSAERPDLAESTSTDATVTSTPGTVTSTPGTTVVTSTILGVL